MTKLPDTAGVCEAHWSSSYASNPGGLCGRKAPFVLVVERNYMFLCGIHAAVIGRRLLHRGAKVFLWYLLKRRAKLVTEILEKDWRNENQNQETTEADATI